MIQVVDFRNSRAVPAGPAKRVPRSVDRSSPAWLMTYGDMATLLLVFFVFLFSVSEVREDKFRAAAGALRAQIGVRPKRGSTIEARKPLDVRRRERRERPRRGLPGTSEKVLAAAWGPRVVVGGSITFDRGSADISDEAKHKLRELADELRGLPNVVEVRGHAAPGEWPRGVRHPSEDRPAWPYASGNEDDLALSLARAATVVRFLVEDAGLKLSLLRAVGAGSAERAFHSTERPERDRRVEIVVLRQLAREERPEAAAGHAVPARKAGSRAGAVPGEEREGEGALPPVMGPLDVGPGERP